MTDATNGRKFRTLHIDSSAGWRGGQNQVFLLCRGLARRGHDVALITPPGSALGYRLHGAGVRLYDIPQRGGLNLRAAWNVRQLVRHLQPDLVHVHDAHAHSTAVLAVGRRAAPPVFVSRRVDFEVGRGWFSRRKYLHPACRYLAISNGVREVLERGGVPSERIRLAPSGVDPAKFRHIHDGSRLRRELAFPEETFVIGTTGALVDHKDHATLIRAARRVVDADPNVIFLIAGRGELLRSLQDLIDELNLRKHVRLLGYREDVEACLAGFDLFVVSSHLEGLCTSIVDAMLMRAPVVATAVGGIPDVVCDRETGLLAPPRDPEKLAAAILEMKASPELRRELADRAERHALENFTADNMVEATLKAYRECL